MRVGARAATAAFLLATVAALSGSCQQRPRFDFDFEQDDELNRLEWRCLTLLRVTTDHATSGTRSLEITFHPAPAGQSESYPGIALRQFDPDWTGHRELVLDAFNPEDTDLPLSLRVDDRDAPGPEERYSRSFAIRPGANRVSIPLAELVAPGARRPLDLRRIRQVVIFLAHPAERRRLVLDRLRLE